MTEAPLNDFSGWAMASAMTAFQLSDDEIGRP
jgi:hypothetical protein